MIQASLDSQRCCTRSKLGGVINMLTTITATQKFNAVRPIIRVNATELYVYKLRNMKDLDTFIDEVSAVLYSNHYSIYIYICHSDIGALFFICESNCKGQDRYVLPDCQHGVLHFMRFSRNGETYNSD